MLNGALGLGFVLSARDATGPAFKSVRDKFGQLQAQARKFKSEAKDTFSGLFAARGWERLQAGFRQAGAAAERFRQQVRNVRTELNSMHQRGMDSRAKVEGIMGDVRGTGMQAAAAGGVGVGALLLAANKSGELTDALAGLKVVSGATSDEMARLRTISLEMGRTTQYSASEVATSLTDIASAGYNATESVNLLRPSLNLATASLGQLTASDAAAVTAQTLKAFRIESEGAGGAVDKLVASMNLFAVQAKDLPLGLANSTRGAVALNQSLDETLVAFGLVKNIIPRVETAATAVSVAMERMVNTEVQDELRKMGVEAVDPLTKKFRPFLDIVGDLEPALGKMSETESAAWLQATFGAEALTGLNAIMTQMRTGVTTTGGEVLKGGAALKHLRDQMASSQGTAQRFADEMASGLPGSMRQLKAAATTVTQQLGEPIAAALKPLAEGALGVIRSIGDALDRMSPEAKITAARIALVATAVTAVVGAMTAASAAFSIWKAGMAAAQATGLMTAGTMLPMLLVFGLIAIAAAGFKRAIDKNVGGSSDKLKEFADAGEWLKAKVLGVWDALTQFVDGAAEGFSTFVPAILTAFSELGSAFKDFGTDAFGGSEDANRFATTGQKVGAVVGKLVVGVIKLTTLGVRVADFFFTAGHAAYSLLDRLGLLDFAVENAHGIIATFIGLKVAAWAYGAAAAMTPLTLKILVVAAAFAAVAAAINQVLALWREWDENSGTQLWNQLKYDVTKGIDPNAAKKFQQATAERQGIKSEYGLGDADGFARSVDGEDARVYTGAASGILGGAVWRAAEIARAQAMPATGTGPDMSKIDAAASKLERAANALSKGVIVNNNITLDSAGNVTGGLNIE